MIKYKKALEKGSDLDSITQNELQPFIEFNDRRRILKTLVIYQLPKPERSRLYYCYRLIPHRANALTKQTHALNPPN